ncbi:hypothetical protein Belba_0873 [Belliella baltica DSM 15883]|uniref:Uncharacterized protein n=1 Tax=Belliella baltica (strain DSM 15883 / CIP 108006 / LMG 21964 / BA134) TaxID=866536 RepID=I3Z2Q2_BELBD|nr:hypothetical protein [Belliella baltica]AFL83520.1 hypothetical protein Belba_0873 [Belliella baltica DSM 15883]
MNKITVIGTEYITPSRTLETIALENSRRRRCVFVYNYEGTHFRFFDTLISVLEFFQSGKDSSVSFNTEDELDSYLKNY